MSGGPQVGVVMGSDSDWPVLAAAVEALAEFGIGCETDVVSAHRTPREMIEYGSAAAGPRPAGDRRRRRRGSPARHARLGHAAAGDRRAGAARAS